MSLRSFAPRITKAEKLEWIGTQVFFGKQRAEGRVSNVYLIKGQRFFDIRLANGVTITRVTENGFDAEGAR